MLTNGAGNVRLNLKWPVVILAFLLTFASIYGLNYWRQQRLVKEPLKEALLKIDAVKDININNSKQQYTEVLITIDKVEDLSKTYQEIEEALFLTYPENSVKIALIDKRNAYLETVFEKVHFALMEGERLGNYTEMSQKIDQLLEQEKELENYRLRVDQKNIYVQLETKNNFLYEVIPITYSITEVNNA